MSTRSYSPRSPLFAPVVAGWLTGALLTGAACDPTNDTGDTHRARVDVPASAAAIETYLREGMPDEAIRVADRLRELEPESALAAELQGRALLMAATHSAELGGDPMPLRREALTRYDDACRLAPDQPGLWRSQGVVADMIGDSSLGAACYERACALDPASMQDRLMLGLARLRLREFSSAGAAMDEALALAPDSPWPLSARASLLAEQGLFPEALASARRACALAPREHALSVNLAKILRQSGAPASAVELLSALAAAGDRTRGATDELALSLIDLGRVADAAQAWNDFALANPRDALAASEAGRLWWRAGDRARARACIDLARVAQPASSVADDLKRLIDDDEPR